MRTTPILVLGLFGIGFAMTQLDVSARPEQQAVAEQTHTDPVWRRTSDGWERADSFLLPEPVESPPPAPPEEFPLHPARLAMWMFAASLAALVAFPAPKKPVR